MTGRATAPVAIGSAGPAPVQATPAGRAGEPAPDRMAELDRRLGDPYDDGNPVGYRAVLAADERAELLADGERMLDGYGLNAEFVPVAYGGRFTEADRLVRTLRSVFRRDGTLGLGYGVTNFIAGAPIWTAGDADQCRFAADVLLRHRKMAAGYNELPRGNDFTRCELTADRVGDQLRLTGRKQVVNNIARADAAVFLARTSPEPGNRSHSHVLVDLTALDPARRRYLDRHHTVGLRGCQIAGVEFDGCPTPANIVGAPGEAMETVLRAFQVTRSVLPAMAVAGLDTQLRTVLRFTRARRLYGRTLLELPHARSVLVGAYLDLLAADCLGTVVARALHVLPAQTSVLSAAAKYLVPKLIYEASNELAVLLGARSYLREGPYAIFQKNLRDIPAASFTHANAAVCLATMIPQLPRLASRSWLRADEPPAELFRLDHRLGPLDFRALELTARGVDNLSGTLPASQPAVAGEPALARLCAGFVAELGRLAGRATELPPRGRTIAAGRGSFLLADRYAVLLAASACLGVWRRNRRFQADTGWLTGTLWRLADRLGHEPGPLPDGLERRLAAELISRADEPRGFDLAAPRLAG
ncbi:MAG TPA: acyl-CoA dehydrogenase [Mycobacteriales bacterium]|nr:acyl-CoA dehydrogenase [Mycobacteriales bacterium]